MVQDPDGTADIIVDSVNYRIHDGHSSILVKVKQDGKMTITPRDACKDSFVFRDSDPKVVRQIAYLLWKASSLLCEAPGEETKPLRC